MGRVVYTDNDGPFLCDEVWTNTMAGWYSKIYKDVTEYMVDQWEPEVTRPKRTPLTIDVVALG